MDAYESDAVMNGLKYDRHSELMAIEMFAQNIMEAGHDFLKSIRCALHSKLETSGFGSAGYF